MSWAPDRITAMVLVIGCLVLIFTGRNSEVKSILTVAAGWLFGTAYADRPKKEVNRHGKRGKAMRRAERSC